MKLNVQGFSRKAQILAMLASGIMPAVILALAYFADAYTMVAWVLAAVYFLLELAGLAVPGKWRVISGIVFALVFLGIGWGLMAHTGEVWLLICALIFAALSFWSIQIGNWAWNEEVPIGVVLCCLGLHVVAQFILKSIKNSGAGSYTAVEYSLLAAFWIFMFTAILRMNRDSLFFASHGSRRASETMRLQNVILTASVAIVAAVLSAAAPIHAAVKGVLRLLEKILFPSGNTEAATEAGYTATEAAVPTETVEAFVEDGGSNPVIDRILLILTYILFAIIAVLGLYLVVRLLIALCAGLIKWLGRFSRNVSQDYVDEITDIRDGSAEKSSLFARMRTRILDAERSASPRERIRHRYRVLKRRHPKWTDSSTARENIPEEMAALYERARYSTHDLDDEDASLFKAGTRRV